MAQQGVVTIQNRYAYDVQSLVVDQGATKVFAGSDLQSKSNIAIKVMTNAQRGVNGQAAAAEALRILKGTKCEYVLEVKDIVNTDSATNLITEWCERGSLKQYIQSSFLDEKDALLVFKHVAAGLKEYHDKELTHGAVQLGNVWVANGYFKLGSLEDQVEERYLAPEVSSPDKKSKKSDVWALGVLLFVLMKGDFPFQSGKDALGAINGLKYVFDEKTSAQEHFIYPVTISKRCQQFISRMLSVNPSERPSMQDLLSNQLLDPVKISNTTTVAQRASSSSRIMMDQFASKYTLFLESAERYDVNGYLEQETIYFGVCPERRHFVKVKQINCKTNQASAYLPKLKQFSETEDQGCLKIYDFGQNQQTNSIILFQEYYNQSNLNDFLLKRKAANVTRTEVEGETSMRRLLASMNVIQSKMGYHGSIHVKNVFVHNGDLKIGEPLNLSDAAQTQLAKDHQQMDFFAPEYKRDLLEKDPNANLTKADVWSYGMLYYTVLYGDPQFDSGSQLKFPNQASLKNQYAIQQCLESDVNARSNWAQVNQNMNLNDQNIPRPKVFQQQFIKQVAPPPPPPPPPVIVQPPPEKRVFVPLPPPPKPKPAVQASYIIAQQPVDSFLDVEPEEPELRIIPVKLAGGERMRSIKNFFKALFCAAILLAVFFRPALVNSFIMMISRTDMKRLDLSYQSTQSGNTVLTNISIITSDTDYYKYNQDSKSVIASQNCLNNFIDPNWHQRELVSYIHSTAFFFWAFFCLIAMILTVIFRVWFIVKLDWYTVYTNWVNPIQAPYNRYLIACQLLAHFDFAFLYYVHFQLFSFFYFMETDPCLAVTFENNVAMLFDSTLFLFRGQAASFLTRHLFTLGLVGYVITISLFFYLRHPMKTSGIFQNYIYLAFRIITYAVIILVCRFGALAPFQPQIFHDPNNIISESFSNSSFTSVIGFIPEIIEIFLIILDLLLEALFFYMGQNSQAQPSINGEDPYSLQMAEYQRQNDQSSILNDSKLYYDPVGDRSGLPSARNSTRALQNPRRPLYKNVA